MENVHLRPINTASNLKKRRLNSSPSLSCDTGNFFFPINPEPIKLNAVSIVSTEKRKQAAA